MAQNLGQNFGVSPFPQRQPVRLEQPSNYGTGFSPDGQSYSVIDDFGKIAAQALAEYEARIKNPRNDIWGKTLHEDTPEFLDQTILEPVRRLIGGSQNTTSPVKTFEIGNQLVEYDPRTRKTAVAFTGQQPQRAPDKFPLPTELNLMQQPTGVKMLTMPQIEALLPSLPPQLQTNAPASTYKGWLNSSNAPAGQTQKRVLKYNPKTGNLE